MSEGEIDEVVALLATLTSSQYLVQVSGSWPGRELSRANRPERDTARATEQRLNADLSARTVQPLGHELPVLCRVHVRLNRSSSERWLCR